MIQAFIEAMAAYEQYCDLWMIVDYACILSTYDFEGSIDGGITNEWLKKLEKTFLIIGLIEIEKVHVTPLPTATFVR